ncbi:MAG: HIT domain-containing protein [Anaerolineae bacterium]
MEYIQADKTGECIFCSALKENNDRETHILYRGETSFIILNRYPYNNGHLMVVPYQHVASPEELNEETSLELMLLVSKSLGLLREAMAPEGFNIGANMGQVAGAGVADHFHVHIVPRWAGDTNFMPIIASTRTIPELLNETYDKLRAVLQKE